MIDGSSVWDPITWVCPLRVSDATYILGMNQMMEDSPFLLCVTLFLIFFKVTLHVNKDKIRDFLNVELSRPNI